MSSLAPEVKSPSSLATTATCFAVALLEGFDIQALGVAAPRLVPELHLSATQIGWVFSVSNVGLILGALVGGRLADRWGRKRLLTLATVTFAVFTLAVAAAHGFTPLLIARFLAGVGFGAALPNMLALASEVSRAGQRATTATLMFCGMPLGGGTAALVTRFLASGYDWRLLFIVGGVLPLFVAVAVHLYLVETLRPQSSATQSRVNVVSALLGEDRAVPTLLLWLAFFPTLLILYLILNWLPLLVVAKGLERAVTPWAALAFNYASVVGAIGTGRAVDRLGARWPLVLAYLGVAACVVALALVRDLSSVVVFSALVGFFLLGGNYALYGVAPAYYPPAVRGTGSGASIAVGRAGSVVGPLLAGFLIASGATAETVILYMVPPALIAALAVLLLSFYKPAH